MVQVMAWATIVSPEPFEDVQIMPTKPQEYADVGRYERFLTEDALASICAHTTQLLGNVKFELVIKDDCDALL
jgi:hypothetical protein